MEPFYNNSALKNQRRELRKNATPAEELLWQSIRGGKLFGRKFKRQYSVGNFIVDFYCPKERLAVELDGAHHFTAEGMDADYERDMFLKSCNITVLRFENMLVVESIEEVLEEIRKNFKV